MTNKEGIAVVLRSVGWVVVGFGVGQWLALGSIGWGLIAVGGLLVLGAGLVSH
jgi:hypothetical protein